MVKKLIHRSKHLLSVQNNTILSAALIIAVSYAASAILGLVRNRLLAANFFGGAEAQLDVYFAAFVLPDTIFQLLVIGALSAAFIPVYSKYLAKGDKEANELASATLNSILIILSGIILLIAIFANPISSLIANFPPDQTRLMASLMRLMLISQVFFTISTFLTGIIQSHHRFLIPATAPLLYNVGIILGIIFLTPMIGIYGAAVGVVLGSVMHMLVQIPLSMHLGFRYQPLFLPNHPGVKSIRRLMIPRALSLGADQIERWIAVTVASLLAAGSLSMFNFAKQLFFLPVTLFGVSLGQASFPRLSAQAGDLNLFKKTLAHTLLQIFFFALPATALLLILRIPVVRLVFGANNFPWPATLLTAKTVAIFSLAIVPQSAGHVLSRAFYALEDTKTPLFVSITAVSLSLILSIYAALYLGLGILGLAGAIAISDTLGFSLLLIFLQKKVGRLNIYSSVLKMIITAIFTTISLWIPFRFLDQFIFDTTRTLPLLILTITTTAVGLFVYIIFSYIFKVHELTTLVTILKRLGNWRHLLSTSDEVIEPPLSSDQA